MKSLVATIATMLLVLGFSGALSNSFAASIREAYELQERCGKRTHEIFKKEYGSGITQDKNGSTIIGYRNHYNAKLNKCFFLESSQGYIKSTDGKTSVFDMERLFDINENREFGSYFKRKEDNGPTDCNIERKVFCQSKEEWEALIKPYMEE